MALSLQVQLFGRKDSRDTQKALRFFSERRVPISFVDIARKPPARGELKRFSDRFGAVALIDPDSRAYADQGLRYMQLDEASAFTRICDEPRLLRLPLVRAGNSLSVGLAEAEWRAWLARTDEPPTS